MGSSACMNTLVQNDTFGGEFLSGTDLDVSLKLSDIVKNLWINMWIEAQ